MSPQELKDLYYSNVERVKKEKISLLKIAVVKTIAEAVDLAKSNNYSNRLNIEHIILNGIIIYKKEIFDHLIELGYKCEIRELPHNPKEYFLILN